MAPALQLLRERAGLSRQELADRAGLSLTTITHVENGRKRLSRSAAKKLATALKATIADVWDDVPKFLGYWIDAQGRKWPAQCMAVSSERSSWENRNPNKSFPYTPEGLISSPRLQGMRLDVTGELSASPTEGRIRAIRRLQRAPNGRAFEFWFLHPEDLEEHSNPPSVAEDYAEHAIQTDDEGDEVRSPGASWTYLNDKIKNICEKRGVEPPKKHIGYSRFLLYRDTKGFPWWRDAQRNPRKPTVVERSGSAKYALKDDFKFCKTTELDKIAAAFVELYDSKGAENGYVLAEESGMSATQRCRRRKNRQLPKVEPTTGVREDGVVCWRHLVPETPVIAYTEARSVKRDGLTVKELADVFGVSYPRVMKWICKGFLFAEKKPERVEYDGPNGEQRSMLKGIYRVAVAEAVRWWQQFKPGGPMPKGLQRDAGNNNGDDAPRMKHGPSKDAPRQMSPEVEMIVTTTVRGFELLGDKIDDNPERTAKLLGAELSRVVLVAADKPPTELLAGLSGLENSLLGYLWSNGTATLDELNRHVWQGKPITSDAMQKAARRLDGKIHEAGWGHRLSVNPKGTSITLVKTDK